MEDKIWLGANSKNKWIYFLITEVCLGKEMDFKSWWHSLLWKYILKYYLLYS